MKAIRSIRSLNEGSYYDEMDSPVGRLTLVTSKEGLHAILWDNERESLAYYQMIRDFIKSPNEATIAKTKKQLSEYFENKRQSFDLPLILNGTTFQIQAWQQLQKIPYATTISYGQQAEKIGNKNKARAVGMANRLNPIPIIIPCHRVIGSNGHLVGFAGGLERKTYLLNIERSSMS
jgi:methylated-DNA-[protein]-cysteine S-methyltransferase